MQPDREERTDPRSIVKRTVLIKFHEQVAMDLGSADHLAWPGGSGNRSKDGAPSLKLQASSLTTNPGPCRINLESRKYDDK